MPSKAALFPGFLAIALLPGLVATPVRAQQPATVARPADAPKSGGADGKISPALTGERRPLYRLHKSDVVEVGLTFAPEFNQTVTVRPDGYVSLRALPDMYVEGMTLPDLRDAVVDAYTPTLHEPEVTVVLKEFEKPYFVASGEVGRPGKYELRGTTTVTEAVAMAGGFNGQAKHSQVVLFRRVNDELSEARVLNVKQMLKSHDLKEDVQLRPGDLLFVPQNTISKVRRFLPTSSLGMYLSPAQF